MRQIWYEKRGQDILNNFYEWMLHHLLLFAETELNAVTIKIWSGPHAKAQISGIHASERVWSDNKTKISTMAIYGCNFPIFNKSWGWISRHIRHDSSARRFRSFHRGRVSNTGSHTLLKTSCFIFTNNSIVMLICQQFLHFYQPIHASVVGKWMTEHYVSWSIAIAHTISVFLVIHYSILYYLIRTVFFGTQLCNLDYTSRS